MKVTRREFLTLAGTTAAGLMISSCTGQQVKPIEDAARTMKAIYAKQITTICPYCGVGCGAIVIRDEVGGPHVVAVGVGLGTVLEFLPGGFGGR